MKKSSVLVILLVIAIAAVSIYFLASASGKNKEKEKVISDFNNATYNFLGCETNCPLEVANVQNVSHTLPETNCLKNCLKIIDSFKAKYPDASKTVNQNISSRLVAYSADLISCEAVERTAGNWTKEVNACIKSTLPTLKARYNIK